MALTVEYATGGRWVSGGTTDISDGFDVAPGDLMLIYVIEAEGSTYQTYSVTNSGAEDLNWQVREDSFAAGYTHVQWLSSDTSLPTTSMSGVRATITCPTSRHFRWGVLRIKGWDPAYIFTSDVQATDTTDPYTAPYWGSNVGLILAWGDYNALNWDARSYVPAGDFSELDYVRVPGYATAGVAYWVTDTTVPRDVGITGVAGGKVTLGSVGIRPSPGGHVVQRAVETDIAQAITVKTTHVIDQPIETDLAQPLTHYRILHTGQSTEVDTAGAITAVLSTPVVATVGQATETDSATAYTPVTGAMVVAIAQAEEVDVGQLLGIVVVGQVPLTGRVRLVRTNGIDDHPRPDHGLWRRFAFPRTLPMLLLSGDPLDGPGTVRELLSEGTQYDLVGVDYVIQGAWSGDVSDWVAVTLAAAGYTLVSEGS